MKWLGCLIAVLLSGVAGAQPTGSGVESPPVSTTHRSYSLWIQPVAPALTVPGLILFHRFTLVLPVGLSLPLNPTTELVFELTPILSSGVGVYTAVGLSRRVVPNRSGGGFFIHLKGIGAVGYNAFVELDERYPHHFSPGQAQLSLGLDVGYRFKSGRAFLDLLLGGAIGVGFNMSTPNLGLGMVGLLTSEGRTKLALDPNFHLLRVGTTF